MAHSNIIPNSPVHSLDRSGMNQDKPKAKSSYSPINTFSLFLLPSTKLLSLNYSLLNNNENQNINSAHFWHTASLQSPKPPLFLHLESCTGNPKGYSILSKKPNQEHTVHKSEASFCQSGRVHKLSRVSLPCHSDISVRFYCFSSQRTERQSMLQSWQFRNLCCHTRSGYCVPAPLPAGHRCSLCIYSCLSITHCSCFQSIKNPWRRWLGDHLQYIMTIIKRVPGAALNTGI